MAAGFEGCSGHAVSLHDRRDNRAGGASCLSVLPAVRFVANALGDTLDIMLTGQ